MEINVDMKIICEKCKKDITDECYRTRTNANFILQDPKYAIVVPSKCPHCEEA